MTAMRFAWGNTLASFFRSTAAVIEVTTAGRFDSLFCPNAVSIGAGGDFIQTMPFVDASSVTTIWLHFEAYVSTNIAGLGGGTVAFVTFFNSSGVAVARLIGSGSIATTVIFQYWNGTTFVTLGSPFTMISSTTLTRLDVKLVCGASGTVDVYQGGTNIFSNSAGMNAAVTNVARIQLGNYVNTGSMFISQVMCADFDTRDSRYSPQLANANGFNTAGTGGFADIAETALDESTSISLSTSAQKKSFTHPTFSLPAGYQIGAVCVSGRGRINGTGPSDGKFELRSASTNWPAPAGSGFNTGYEPRGYHWDDDPNGASNWTLSGYNATEFGVEAV